MVDAMDPASTVEMVTVLSPGGFCAGVDMSIDALDWMVDAFDGERVYCYHDIVHNGKVVDDFRRKGVTFVKRIEDVPDGAPLVLSAHGSSPEVVAAANRKTRYLVDTVCPLVRKVHKEVSRQLSDQRQIVYLGHAGHDEAVGTLAIAPGEMTLVQSTADVDAIRFDGRPVAVLTQTTLPDREVQELTRAVKQRVADVWEPPTPDRCFATTNRQDVVIEFADKCDSMIIVGAANSSNTLAMEEVAREAGCAHVERVNDAAEIVGPLGAHVAVAASASTPEKTVQKILEFLTRGDASRLGEFSLGRDEKRFGTPPDLYRLAELLDSEGRDHPPLSANKFTEPEPGE
jgi:4-hydroxy-3-methylbut-2-enyl diphosphate reductase